MKRLKIFFLVLFFLAGDISILGLRATSSARAEEVIQLARLNSRRRFVRRVPAKNRLRAKIQTSKHKGFVRKVASSKRRSRTRRGQDLTRRRLIPRRVVAPVHKRLVDPQGGAIAESRAVVSALRERQGDIRAQFSTAVRRRSD